MIEDADQNLSPRLRWLLDRLWQEWKQIDSDVQVITDELERISNEDARCRQLRQIPGFGPLVASATVGAIGNGAAFRRGRDFAARVGVVPRQYSTGGNRGCTESAELSKISLDKLQLVNYVLNNIYMREDRLRNAEEFLPLKPHWFHLMLCLLSEEQHGYGIMQEVLVRTNGTVRLWPATLYGTIKKLIEEDLIEESDRRPRPELDDARRRYYRLTKLGRRVLTAETARLEELVHSIHSKKGLLPKRV